MGIMEIIGIAGSVSLLSGWRLYLCIFATGLAMRFDAIPIPEHLAALGVLANPWVMGIAAVGALAEFFADKVMWLDSAWDTLHTLIRPVGGALLALLESVLRGLRGRLRPLALLRGSLLKARELWHLCRFRGIDHRLRWSLLSKVIFLGKF